MNHPATAGVVDTGPRDRLARHRERKEWLMQGWLNRQYPLILQARGRAIADAARWEAERQADIQAWREPAKELILTHEQVAICEARAVSNLRMATFGAYPLRRTDGVAREQAEWCRRVLRSGLDPATEPAPWLKVGQALATLQRLGQEIETP